jgi:hypothetical protein
VDADGARPYDLRHSFASLLLHEGRSVIYVARQLGHGAELTMRTYGHVIEELEDRPQLPAEDAIREAREAQRTGESSPRSSPGNYSGGPDLNHLGSLPVRHTDAMADSQRKTGRPDPKVIKDGGYQPTTDPGSVPTSLVRPTNKRPAEKPQQSQDKKK